MGISWYPQDKKELKNQLKSFIGRKRNKKINGIIVPHAGYEYSGQIAGKAFSFLKDKKIKKAIIIGPSHYIYLDDVMTTNLNNWTTPLGNIQIFNTDFLKGDIQQEHSLTLKGDIQQEHSLTNQVPFLQYLGFEEIMPLMVGQITLEKAQEIAQKISKIKAYYVFSTDLSHFLEYDVALKKDKQTIDLIKDLNPDIKNLDACGVYPLLIMMCLCKLKKTKPHLIEYKNSGDVIGDKSAVVGYCTFYF